MSLNFIQFTIPCETCLVQSMCEQKANVKEMKLNKYSKTCLGVPDWDMNEKVYMKGLIECWVNIGWSLITKAISEKTERPGIKKSVNMPYQYIDMLIDIIGTLQWIVNSTSWDEGELYDFDAFEVKYKLKNVSNWLENAKKK